MQKNQQQIKAILRVINDCTEKYPDETFYNILKNLGLIESIGVDYNEATNITIQKLLTSGNLDYVYKDIMYKSKEEANNAVKQHDQRK